MDISVLKDFDTCAEVLDYRIRLLEESYFSSSKDEELLESTSDTFGKKIKTFFVNLILALRRFISDTKIDIEKGLRVGKGRKNLKEIEKMLRKAKVEGKQHCTLTDVESIRLVYEAMYKEVQKVASRFAKPYSDPLQIDKDIEEFNKIIAKYEDKLNTVKDKKINLSIDDGIRLVSKELSGQTRIYDTISEIIANLEKMQHDAELLSSKYKSLGGDMLEKQRGVIVRITSKFVSVVKSFFVRLVVAVCLIF